MTLLATLKVTSPKVEVKKQDASAFKVAKDGAKLREGDTVRTDATGLAEIDYGNDAYTRLDVNTEFTIAKLTDEQGARQVQGSLEVGQTWNRTAAITESGSFEQEGAGANAAVRGTAFAVSCDAPDHCTFIAIEHTTALTGDRRCHQGPHPAASRATRPTVTCLRRDEDAVRRRARRERLDPEQPDPRPHRARRRRRPVRPGERHAHRRERPGRVRRARSAARARGDRARRADERERDWAANGAAIVSFDPPASNGGSPITGYIVTATPVARRGLRRELERRWEHASGSGSPIVVSGLTNTVAYVFTVTATNAVGSSPESGPSNTVTPIGDAPVIDANAAQRHEPGWRPDDPVSRRVRPTRSCRRTSAPTSRSHCR